MKTVLVVDDEADVRTLTAQMLRVAGYDVVEARDGKEAWTYLRRSGSTIDAVLTDVVMPHMTGTELAAYVRKQHPGLPVILMSGYTPDDLLRRGLRLSGGLLLTKPFTVAALLERVHEAFDGTV